MFRALALALFVAALVPLAGCGPKIQDVTGTVSLDGKPVGEASVSFFAADGKTYGGGTDGSGNFTIPAVPTGEYKVVVAKYPKSTGTASEDGKMDKSYLDSMMKGTDKTKGGTPMMPMPGKGGKGMMPPTVGGAGSGVKSELPEQYASLDKTPLTAKVPTEGGIQLQLKK
jgi:Carboxypeptidase regulatory-like domain